jgi:hypothetical protein
MRALAPPAGIAGCPLTVRLQLPGGHQAETQLPHRAGCALLPTPACKQSWGWLLTEPGEGHLKAKGEASSWGCTRPQGVSWVPLQQAANQAHPRAGQPRRKAATAQAGGAGEAHAARSTGKFGAIARHALAAFGAPGRAARGLFIWPRRDRRQRALKGPHPRSQAAAATPRSPVPTGNERSRAVTACRAAGTRSRPRCRPCTSRPF